MYAPNQYYKPYTSNSSSRSRRNSLSSEAPENPLPINNVLNSDPNYLSESKRGFCSVKCCCLTILLILISVSTVIGVMFWMMNRNEVSQVIESQNNSLNFVNNNTLSDVSALLSSEKEQNNFIISQPKNDNIVFPKETSNILKLKTRYNSETTTTSTSSHRWIFCQKNQFFPQSAKNFPILSFSEGDNCSKLHFFGKKIAKISILRGKYQKFAILGLKIEKNCTF